MKSSYTGRRPIFDRSVTVIGYELTNTLSDEELLVTDIQDETKLLFDTVKEIGLGMIVQNKMAFIPLSSEFIEGGDELPFTAESITLDFSSELIEESVAIESIKSRVKEGYIVVVGSALAKKVDECDIVSYDLQTVSLGDIEKEVDQVVASGRRVLVRGVDKKSDFDRCEEIGCELFQGSFLVDNDEQTTDKLPSNHLALVQILAKLQDSNISIEELEQLVMQDAGLSYRLLKHINSAAFSLNSRVESIGRAISFLGLNTVRKWVTIMALSGVDDRPSVLMENALFRSKMCELIARKGGKVDAHSAGTVGLLSSLDTLLKRPLEMILEELPLSDDVNKALLEFEGDIGEILYATVLYENMDLDSLELLQGIDTSILRSCYVKAIGWAAEIIEQVNG
jgi:EAL and modified HD-GYP domain-containing signal transduction protein